MHRAIFRNQVNDNEKIMNCKHCGHTVIMAGGMCFHAENGFSQICKICGCRFPEQDEEQTGEKT